MQKAISICGIVTVTALTFFAGCKPASRPDYKPRVHIGMENGKYMLFRNDTPFIIKGAAGFTHLGKLQEAGGNTIRVWDTLHLGRILDEAQAHNIAVIAGFPMPASGFLAYYEDTAKTAAQYTAFRAVVNRYKSHPALLMWCLGNELNFPYRPMFKPFYKAYNRLVNMVHTEDPDHPVTTAIINLDKNSIYNLRWKVHGLDLLSINIFNQLRSLEQDLGKVSWAWNGPFLITEWGVNGPWESEFTAWGSPIENTSTRKAEQYRDLYEQHMPVNHPRFLGACVFFWGSKQEVTHTWFSTFSNTGAISQTVNTLQYLWTGQWPAQQAPALKYMLVNGKGARDNILLKPGAPQKAEVLFETPPADSLRIYWEILPEDWYMKDKYTPNTRKPAPLKGLQLSAEGYAATFRAPQKEGPYRVFVTVFDNKGQYASANTPFYVVGP